METDCPCEKLVRPFLNHESARIYRGCNHIRGGRRRGDENRPSLPGDAGAHTAVRIRNRATRDVWRIPQSCAHRICKRHWDLPRVIVHRVSSRQLCVLSTCAGAGRLGRRNIDSQWCSDCLLLEIDSGLRIARDRGDERLEGPPFLRQGKPEGGRYLWMKTWRKMRASWEFAGLRVGGRGL